MKQFLKLLQWTLNAAVFFTLFAFALNNQHEAKVYFFFGTQWRSPMVLIVLMAFALGMVVGVLGMVPRWWRQKQAAKAVQTTATPVSSSSPSSTSNSASNVSTAYAPTEISHGT
jgi:putative membrane protein